MPRTDVTVLTEDGACTATLHTPSSHGSWPVSVQIRSHPATASASSWRHLSGSGWTPAHTRSASPGKCPANGVTAGSFLACTPYPVCAG
jgi:hypothetical protein